MEDSDCDQTGESGSTDVGCEEDRYPGCDLLSVVEHGKHVKGTGVEGGFGYSQEETGEQEALEVLGDGGKCADDGP